MESAAWTQPAVTTPPATPAATVPRRVIEFGYDAFSRRIRKKVFTQAYGSSTWGLATWEAYAYDGWNMIATYRLTTASAPAVFAGTAGGIVMSGGYNVNYIWGPDFGSRLNARGDWQRAGGIGGLLMASYPNSSGYYAYDIKVPSMDPMGNVLGVDYVTAYASSGGMGGSAYIYDYDAFGKEVRSSSLIGGSPDSFPFHYSTKFTDTESGLNYYGYRYYDPAKGRWLSRDPIGERGGVNLYEMVDNDAVGGIDVSGNRILVMGDTMYHQVSQEYAGKTKAGDAKFANQIKDALQKGISKEGVDCLKLKVVPVYAGPVIKFFEIKYDKGADLQSPKCKCANVERLKQLLDNERAAKIFNTDIQNNAVHHPIPVGLDTNVHVDPSTSISLPTANADGSRGPMEKADFGTIVWHETVGHAGLYLENKNSSH